MTGLTVKQKHIKSSQLQATKMKEYEFSLHLHDTHTQFHGKNLFFVGMKTQLRTIGQKITNTHYD